MTTDKEVTPLALLLLQELVELCKKQGQVNALAAALESTPQAIYAWAAGKKAAGGGPVIRPRTAKARLLEISRLRSVDLGVVVAFAGSAVQKLESAEDVQ